MTREQLREYYEFSIEQAIDAHEKGDFLSEKLWDNVALEYLKELEG